MAAHEPFRGGRVMACTIPCHPAERFVSRTISPAWLTPGESCEPPSRVINLILRYKACAPAPRLTERSDRLSGII